MSSVFGKQEAIAPHVCETPFNPNANTWWEIQEKVFTRWCNTHLAKRDVELPMGGMLRGGLDSGLVLWDLLAEISNKEDEMGRPNRRPKMKIHKINNILLSLQFLDREKVKLVNIGAEDIVDRKLNLILGLIWTLILRYQIQKGKADAHGSAKNELLKWLNSIGINVKDLTHDWSDGKQICNLLNKIRDDVVPKNKITDSPVENIQTAIDIAADEFDIPRVIDATDMASDDPDELVNMTYLSYFRDKWDELKAMATGELLGENPRTVKAKKPVNFSLSTYNVSSPNQITIRITDKLTGKEVAVASHTPVKFDSPKKDQWDVTFTPLKEDNLSVDMFINGKPVKGAPLVLFVTPPSFAKVIPGDRKATATKPFKLQLQTAHITPQDLNVDVKDDKGKKLPFELVEAGAGIYDVKFTPTEAGNVTVDVKLDGENVQGAPVHVDVDPAPWANLRTPEGKPTASKVTSLVLDVVNVKPDDLVATVKDAQGNVRSLGRPKDNKDGTFTLDWTPNEKGKHIVEVALEGKPVKGSPLTVDVDPAPWARLNRPEAPPTASKPCKMIIDTINVKPADLVASVKDDKGNKIAAPKLTDKGNGKFELEFTPSDKGKHTVEVLLEGKPIEGSPLAFTVDPKPWAKIRKAETAPVAGKPFKLVLDTINVKPTDLDANIVDDKGNNTKPVIRDRGDGTFEVEFTPSDKGNVKVDIKLDGQPIEGSPMSLSVDPKPWAKLLRPAAPPVASKPFKMQLEVINVKPSDLKAKVTDANNQALPAPTITDNKNGTFDLVFTPKDEGKLVVEVLLEGDHVEGSPMILTSDPKPWAKLRQPDKAPVAGKPFKMFLDTVNVKPKDLDGTITDGNGKVTKPTIKDLGNGTYEVEFTPNDKGKVRVNVDLEGKPVEGSPLTLDVEPKPWAKLVKPKENPVAAHPFTMKLETINVKPDDLSIKVVDANGKALAAPTVKDNKDGTFDIVFTPDNKGAHTISVDLEGKPVEGSPMKLDVEACPWARVIGASIRPATASKPFVFGVEYINVKPDDLKVTVKDPQSGKILVDPKDIKKVDNKNDTMDISFIPPTHGDALVEVLLEGKPIEGSPLHLSVAHKPTARVKGPSNLNAVATKPFKFALDVINVKPEDLDISVVDANGKPLPVHLEKVDDKTIDIGFTPMEPGVLKAHVKLDGDGVEGAPVTINVAPKPAAFYNGPTPVRATAGKPCIIKLESVNLKPDELDVDIRDRDGAKVPAKVRPIGNDAMEIEFTPTDPGTLLADLKVEGEPIEGAPIPIEVDPAPFARLVKPLEGPVADRPYKLRLETVNVKPGDLDVSVVDDKGNKLPVDLRDNHDGTFDLTFTPSSKGGVTAKVNLEGKPVEGSPLRLDVASAPWAKLLGENPAKATARRPFKFEMETVNVEPDDLVINIVDKYGKRLPYRVRDTGAKNGEKAIFDVKLKPREEGPLKAEVLLEGSPVVGSPLQINVAPEPYAKLLGDSNRHCKVNDTVKLLVEVVNLKPDDLTVHVMDASGNKVKGAKIHDVGNGTFEVTFVPDQIARYTADILYAENEESIEGCPCTIDADPKTNWSDQLKDLLSDMDEAKYFTLVPVSDLEHLETQRPVIFHAVPNTDKKLHATSVAFTAIVTPESGGQVPALVTGIEDGKFQVRFVPLTREKHTVDVQLSKKSINNSPQDVYIGVKRTDGPSLDGDKSMKIGMAIDRTGAVVGSPITFEIVYENAEPKLITHKVLDPSGQVVQTSTQPGRSTSSHSGTTDVTLTPTVKGTHSVRLYYEGAPTSGEATQFEVNPASAATVTGPSSRSDGAATVPYTVKVASVNVKQSQVTVGVKGPDGKVIASLNLDPTGKDTMRSRFTETPGRPKNPNGVFDGTFDLTFTPKDAGKYSMMIFLDKKPIQGSPVAIEVGVSPKGAVAVGDTTAVEATPSPQSARSHAPPALSPRVGTSAPVTVQATPVATSPMSVARVGGNTNAVNASSQGSVRPTVGATATVNAASPNAVRTTGATATVTSSSPRKVQATGETAAVGSSSPRSESSDDKSPRKHHHRKHRDDKDHKKHHHKKKDGESKPAKTPVEVTTTTRTLTRVTVGKSFTIRLQVAGSNGAPATAPIKQNGKVIAEGTAKAGKDDTYEISWTPTHAGIFTTVLVVAGNEVGGSAFEFEAFNVPITCRPIANSDDIGPGIPCTITFAIDNATPSKLTAVIKGSDGKRGTDVTTTQRLDGTWDVTFKPPDSPSFTVELMADHQPVENKLTIQLV